MRLLIMTLCIHVIKNQYNANIILEISGDNIRQWYLCWSPCTNSSQMSVIKKN